MFSIREMSNCVFNSKASLNIALFVSSPAYSEGIVDEGGFDNIEMMSVAACCK